MEVKYVDGFRSFGNAWPLIKLDKINRQTQAGTRQHGKYSSLYNEHFTKGTCVMLAIK